MIKKYRKKPVIIEAIQWLGTSESYEEICEFMRGIYVEPLGNGEIKIPTLEGEHIASVGDYIIKGVKGEFYPCKPDIFEMTYEEVEDE